MMNKEKDNRKQRALQKKIDGVFMPVSPVSNETPEGYINLLEDIKQQVRNDRMKAVLSANSAMVLMYWNIGSIILKEQTEKGWGAKIIDRLSHDLKEAFPDMTGFSPRNLKYMRKFAESWTDIKIVQRTVAQIPWRTNLALLDKLKDRALRLWYAQQTISNGWSRDLLVFQIEAQLHARLGETANNFDIALPPDDSDMANQIFKDPYIFDFIGTADTRRESELEQKLIDHLEKFLLELGQGFAFVGRQVMVEFSDKD